MLTGHTEFSGACCQGRAYKSATQHGFQVWFMRGHYFAHADGIMKAVGGSIFRLELVTKITGTVMLQQASVV